MSAANKGGSRQQAKRRAWFLLPVLCAAIGLGVVLWSYWTNPASERPDPIQVGESESSAVVEQPVLVARGSEPAESGGPAAIEPEGAATVTGVVIRSVDGAPVPGVRVAFGSSTARRISLPAASAVLSDADGRFSAEVDMPFPIDLLALTEGYAPALLRVDGPSDVVVRLERGASIRGRVLTPSGAAVSGATVWAVRGANRMSWPVDGSSFLRGPEGRGARTTSSSDGSFELTGLADGGRYELRAVAAGYVNVPQFYRPLAMAEAGADDVRLVLKQAAEITLRVRSADGQLLPAESLNVSFTPPRGASLVFDWVPVAPRDPSRAQSPPARSEKTFRFARASTKNDLESDSLKARFTVSAPWYADVQVEAVCAWGEQRILEVELARAPGAPRLHRVRIGLSHRGRRLPLSGALLLGVRGEGVPSYGSFPRPGLYVEFEGGVSTTPLYLPTSEHEITVTGGASADTYFLRGSASPWHRVAASDPGPEPERIELALPASPVSLTVVDAEGHPQRGFDLHVASEGARGAERLGWMLRWDQAWAGAYRGLDRDPRCWVSDGRAVIKAGLPGVGQGEVPIDVSSNGEPMEVRIVLAGEYKAHR